MTMPDFTSSAANSVVVPWRGVGLGLLHSFSDHLEARFPWQRRHARRPGLVAPEAVQAVVKVT